MYLVASDESTDNTDMAQLCVYVRFFDGKCFREEMLALTALENFTTGEVISEKIKSFFQVNGLDMNKICLLVTDDTPQLGAYLLGKHQGVKPRLSAVAPQMQSLPCHIHQSVLCSKLSNKMKETMDMVIKMINFIRSTSSLQHWFFRQLLEETKADFQDLLLHNDARWLSKGETLDRFWNLKDNILNFLRTSSHKNADKYRKLLQDNLFAHLNTLNMPLECRERTIINLVEK